jgi:hypothetical protein
MQLFAKAIPRSIRLAVMAATIIATSGVLEGVGLPAFSALRGIVHNLAAAQSEAKKMRDKAAASLRYVNRDVPFKMSRLALVQRQERDVSDHKVT